MWSLFFRNLFFTVLQPGMVAGLIPYWILGSWFSETFKSNLSLLQYAAIVIFIAGLAILLHCIGLFAKKGKGTLSPADPTKKLVASGLYQFSRNPMYVGVMLMLIAEASFFSSVNLWIYAAVIFIAFNLFIIFHEEPRLKRDFGTEYYQYINTVRRWL
jgi:protein-S-isoprenylcysteine O-methyltransferase Ste14